jgi:predicted MFS family arabinose efflux permease
VSDEFAAAASRLAGFAGALLGWRPAEFWAATPAELAVILTAMLHPDAAALPPDDKTLQRLMEAFPDG